MGSPFVPINCFQMLKPADARWTWAGPGPGVGISLGLTLCYEYFQIKLRTQVYVDAVKTYLKELPLMKPNQTFCCNKGPVPGACDPDAKHKTIDTSGAKEIVDDWVIGDGGCQFELTLNPNSYVKDSVGKIDIDMHESVSNEATIRNLVA